MKDKTAFLLVKGILVENRDRGSVFEGVLNRSRVAALRRILALAEPEFIARRRGGRVTLYQRAALDASGRSRYRRIARVKLPNRSSLPRTLEAHQK